MLIPESVEGHRVGWFPGTRLLFAEGHPTPGELTPPAALWGVAERLEGALKDLGVAPPQHLLAPSHVPTSEGMVSLPVVGGTGFAGIRRLDATCDLPFDRPSEGLAALTGVAALSIPRVKTEVFREVGGRRVETVYLRGSGGKRVLGRGYDKGVESGRADRGLLIRPEDQRRFSKAFRPSMEHVSDTSFVRDGFVRRFEPLWKASKGVLVADLVKVVERVRDLVDEGEVSELMAEKLVGHLVLDAANVDLTTRSTRYRRQASCRELGLVLADGALDEEVEVELREILERAFDSEAWGARG
jgi:hypothetical protein